jgi:hypothetical protein
MSHVFATGDLQNISDQDVHTVSGIFGEQFGILLTGTFAGGNVLLQTAHDSTAPTVVTFMMDARDVSLSTIIYSKVGLFYFSRPIGRLQLKLSSGSDGVTDIDYTIFVGSRP